MKYEYLITCLTICFIVLLVLLVLSLAPLYFNKNKRIVDIDRDTLETFYKTPNNESDLINLFRFVDL